MRARKRKPEPLRVLIADDHRLFAEALEAILTTDDRIEVVGQASDAVRVLMLTGSNSRADVDRSRAAGASGYVTKDRIASELVATIVEVTRRRLP